MQHYLCLFFSCFLAHSALAQKVEITFEIKGLQTPVIVLGYYSGGKAYRLDSVQVNSRAGLYRWEETGLQPGVYFCSDGTRKLLDFIVKSPVDTFTIGLDVLRIDSAWSSNSDENEAFFRFEQGRKLLEGKFEAKKSMRSMIAQATKNDPEALKSIDAELDGILLKTDSLALDYVNKNRNHLYARMLFSVRPPEAPPALKQTLKNGKPNPKLARWVREHYWDNTDFKDESLLRNTFWHVYFDNFFSRYVTLQPDSIIIAIDEVLAKTPKNGTFYRFIVLRITQFYEQNDVPGADRIFVHMVDKFLKKGETPWMDMATLERLAYKADAHRPNLTGSMAVNFTMPDEKGKPVELYEVQAPCTVLIFYSPLCSHCMEIMPNLYQVYLDYQPKGLAAIAINTDKESEYWRKFVTQQNWSWYDVDDPTVMDQLDKQFAVSNLPMIFVLDKDKRILAKKVKPNELGAVLARSIPSGN